MTDSENRSRSLSAAADRRDAGPVLAADGGRPSDPPEEEDDRDVLLVVDDDEAFAETIEIWLEPEMVVRVAHDGAEAVEAYGPDVDVVVLDRKMPMMSGDEALERIRAQAGDPSVAVMTAISPNESIVAMDFDTYLQKPVMKDELVGAIERLRERIRYPDEVRRLFSIRSKVVAFRETHSEKQLAESEPYRRLTAEFDRLFERASEQVAALDDDEISRLEEVTEANR